MTPTDTVSREMPLYKCHKEVWALKIAAIEVHRPTIAELDLILAGGPEGPAATITPAEAGYAPFIVNREYLDKHKPQAGGYFVVYADGYRSFSPAKAFEEGYALIS